MFLLRFHCQNPGVCPPRRAPSALMGKAMAILSLVVAFSASLMPTAGATRPKEDAKPVAQSVSVGLFPVQAATAESAGDVNLVESMLQAAMQEAAARQPVVTVTILSAYSAPVRDLVDRGVLPEGAVGREMSVANVGAIVRSLEIQVGVLPRVERVATKAHPAFRIILGVLLPQSGQMEDLTIPGLAEPALLATGRDFEAGVKQFSARLASNCLPALVEMASRDHPLNPEAAEQSYQLAQEEIAAGNSEQASRLLQQAVLLAPHKAEYSLLLGDVLLRLNRPVAAADAYCGAVQGSPDSLDARKKYADCLVQLSRFSEAEKQLIAARGLAPKDASPVVGLAGVYLRQKDNEKALRLLESASQEISDPTIQTQLGDVYRLLQQPDAAEAAYERALKLGAAPESCYARLASLFADRKDFVKSFRFLAQVAQQWAGPKPLSPGEVKNYLQMTQAALVQNLDQSRQEIIEFTQMQQSRVRLFQHLSTFREETLDLSSFLDRVEAPEPFTDLVSQWQAITVLVSQIMLDHLIYVDTNDTSYSLVANELRVRANTEMAEAQRELAKTP